MNTTDLTPQHLRLAKEFANQVWDKYPDEHYKEQKTHRNNLISDRNSENMWAIINQFDMINQIKVWELAKAMARSKTGKNQRIARDLVKWLESEYINVMRKEFGTDLT